MDREDMIKRYEEITPIVDQAQDNLIDMSAEQYEELSTEGVYLYYKIYGDMPGGGDPDKVYFPMMSEETRNRYKG